MKYILLLMTLCLVSCAKEIPVDETIEYTLTVDYAYGDNEMTYTYYQGQMIETLEDLTREGFKFIGYELDGKPLVLPYKMVKDTVIKAIWAAKPKLTLDYRITYDAYPEGEYVLPIPNRANYRFYGWFDNEDFIGKPIEVVNLTEDLHLFACFELEIDAFDQDMKNLATLPVSDHLSLPSTFNGFDISYTSSSQTITPEGKFNKPFVEEYVTLTATITDGKLTEERSYTFKTVPYPALEAGKIRSSYTRMFSGLTDKYFESVDIINPSFATVNEHGYFLTPNYFTNVNVYIMPKARQYNNRVMLVVGPGTDWSGMVKNGTKAFDTFVDNLVEAVLKHGFAGVDIDWETPKGQTEAVWYVYLMEQLHTKLKAKNPNYLITSAIAGGQWQPQHYNLKDSGQYHDYINMMAYDMVNSGGGYQNALFYRSGYHDTTLNVGRVTLSCSIDESVAIYNGYGIPNSKIIAGVAFYGRNQTLKDGVWDHAGYATSYHYIKVLLDEGELIEKYDSIAQVPYAVNAQGTRFVSYDNRRSILAKGEYVKTEGLAGLMNWDQSHDNQFELIGYMSQALK